MVKSQMKLDNSYIDIRQKKPLRKNLDKSYEEIRQKRIQENMKRMAELNLPKLAQTLHSISPKPSPMKPLKPRTLGKETMLVQVRRSSRVANLPAPVYKEVVIERFERTNRSTYSCRRQDLSNRFYASDEARANATERAEKLQSSLGDEYPSFVRPMLPSHVSGCFWLGLPSQFCKASLPMRDEQITLVDEEGGEYPTVYLFRKSGLSGGWMGFARAHELVDGDALVFQLVEPTQFKVYIIRVNGSSEDDEVLQSVEVQYE